MKFLFATDFGEAPYALCSLLSLSKITYACAMVYGVVYAANCPVLTVRTQRRRRGQRRKYPDVKRTLFGPYEKADTSRWNFRCGGAMLTGILEKMVGVHGGRPQPPSGAIATIVLVVTLIADVRAVV